jgi:hypothetical protein
MAFEQFQKVMAAIFCWKKQEIIKNSKTMSFDKDLPRS